MASRGRRVLDWLRGESNASKDEPLRAYWSEKWERWVFPDEAEGGENDDTPPPPPTVPNFSMRSAPSTPSSDAPASSAPSGGASAPRPSRPDTSSDRPTPEVPSRARRSISNRYVSSVTHSQKSASTGNHAAVNFAPSPVSANTSTGAAVFKPQMSEQQFQQHEPENNSSLMMPNGGSHSTGGLVSSSTEPTEELNDVTADDLGYNPDVTFSSSASGKYINESGASDHVPFIHPSEPVEEPEDSGESKSDREDAIEASQMPDDEGWRISEDVFGESQASCLDDAPAEQSTNPLQQHGEPAQNDDADACTTTKQLSERDSMAEEDHCRRVEASGEIHSLAEENEIGQRRYRSHESATTASKQMPSLEWETLLQEYNIMNSAGECFVPSWLFQSLLGKHQEMLQSSMSQYGSARGEVSDVEPWRLREELDSARAQLEEKKASEKVLQQQLESEEQRCKELEEKLNAGVSDRDEDVDENDLLMCLGQESKRRACLEEYLTAKGEDVNALLKKINEEEEGYLEATVAS